MSIPFIDDWLQAQFAAQAAAETSYAASSSTQEIATPAESASQPQACKPVEEIAEKLELGEKFSIELPKLIGHVLANRSLSEDLDCQTMKLASKWIKNSAEHVCSDPSQAIVELIQNGLDACRPESNSLGQFGLGFFSVLGLMKPGSVIAVRSRRPEEKDPGVVFSIEKQKDSYRVTFFPQTFKHLRDMSLRGEKGSGTSVVLYDIPRLLEDFGPIRARFAFVPDSALTWDSVSNEGDGDVFVTPGGVVTSFLNHPIKIEDKGRGLSLHDAITKMLVPSSSSKAIKQGIPQSCPVRLDQWEGKPDPKGSYLLVTIEGTVAMKHQLRHPLPTEKEGKPADIVIEMPLGTRPTLSRDEILIEAEGTGFEEQCLLLSIRRLVRETLQGTQDSELLGAFYLALRDWELRTSSRHIGSRFSSALKESYTELYEANQRVVALPPESFQNLKQILASSPLQLISMHRSLVEDCYMRLEDCVDELAKQQIHEEKNPLAQELRRAAWDGRVMSHTSIGFVPDAYLPKDSRGNALTSSLGLMQTIFAPESLLALCLAEDRPLQKLQSELAFRHCGAGAPQLLAADRRSLYSDPITRQLQWAENHYEHYQSSGRCQNFYGRFYSFFSKMSSLEERVSSKVWKHIQRLMRQASSMTDRYLTIPPEEFPYEYGSGNTLRVVIPDHRELSYSIPRTLTRLPKNLAVRLLQMTIEHFAFLTEAHAEPGNRQRLRIKNNQLVVPVLDAHTPLAVISELVPRQRELLIHHARSTRELLYLCYLFEGGRNEHRGLLFDDSEKACEHLAFFIREFVQNRVPDTEIDAWYENLDLRASLRAISMGLIHSPIGKTLLRYCDEMSKNAHEILSLRALVYSEQQKLLDATPSFTIDQLIQAVFSSGDALVSLAKEGKLQDALQLIHNSKAQLPLRKVKQSVTYSSEQSMLERFFLECLQNSVDAIKAHVRKRKVQVPAYMLFDRLDEEYLPNFEDIDIRVSLHEERSVVLAIRDYIGVKDLQTLLLDLLTPDYSQKDATLHVGQMGNGLFKIFQAARFVTIETRLLEDSEQAYLVRLQPHRSGGVVESISVKIIPSIRIGPGTHIRMVGLPHRSKREAKMEARYALFFLRETLGCAQLGCTQDQKPIKIQLRTADGVEVLNDVRPGGSPLLHQSPSSPSMRVSELHDKTLPSHVTTGGIPFQPLHTLCAQHRLLPPNLQEALAWGYVVEIGPENFKPVQSRTKLQFVGSAKEHLQSLLFDAAYKHFWRRWRSPNLFLHGASSGSMDQLRLNESLTIQAQERSCASRQQNVDIQAWMTYHQPEGQKSFYLARSFAGFVASEYDPLGLVPKISGICADARKEIEAKAQEGEKRLRAEPSKTLQSQIAQELCETVRNCSDTIDRKTEKWAQRRIKCCVLEHDNTPQAVLRREIVGQAVVPWFKMKCKADLPPVRTLWQAEQTYPFLSEAIPRRQEASAAQSSEDKIEIASDRGYTREQLHITVVGALRDYVLHIIEAAEISPFPEVVLTYDPLDRFCASYQRSSNRVTFNTAFYKIGPILDVLVAVSRGDTASAQKSMRGVFTPNAGDVGSLLHELEHLRTRDVCSDGHGMRRDVYGKEVNFNAAAHALYDQAAQQGAVTKWMASAQGHMKENLGKYATQILLFMQEDVHVWERKKPGTFASWITLPL